MKVGDLVRWNGGWFAHNDWNDWGIILRPRPEISKNNPALGTHFDVNFFYWLGSPVSGKVMTVKESHVTLLKASDGQ